MTNLVLFGAGGLGREVLLLLEAMSSVKTPPRSYKLLGFVVNEKYYRKNALVNGYPVLGTEEWLLKNKNDVVCCCSIGTPEARAKIQKELSEQGVNFVSLIHPTVRIPETTKIGKGCLIQAHTTVSADCVFGDGVFLNTYCTVGHDTHIGDYTCIMTATSISGNVKIGEEVRIGGHAYVIPGRKIGSYSTVAAGAVVFTNVKEKTTVIGNPAKRMSCLE